MRERVQTEEQVEGRKVAIFTLQIQKLPDNTTPLAIDRSCHIIFTDMQENMWARLRDLGPGHVSDLRNHAHIFSCISVVHLLSNRHIIGKLCISLTLYLSSAVLLAKYKDNAFPEHYEFMIIFSTLMSFISSQRDQGERGAAAERRHPAVGAGVQGEALRTDPAVQEQQQEGATAAAAAAWEKVDRVEGRKECLLSSLSSFPMPHLHTHTHRDSHCH